MRQLFFILILLFPLTTIGQNPHDSLTIIYKSDKLIEIVNHQFPEIVKRTTPLTKAYVFDGYYINPKQYGVLKNGEIKVYNRFYQLFKHFLYRDSIMILEETYTDGIMTFQIRNIPQDSVSIMSSYYYDNGNLRIQNNDSPQISLTTRWYNNGQIESMCERKGDKEKCDYWDDKGIYKNGIISIYNGSIVISEIEIDKDGKEIKKIK